MKNSFSLQLILTIVYRQHVIGVIRVEFEPSEPKPKQVGHIAQFLQNGFFEFRLLQEGTELANFLSKACPNPNLTVMGLSEIFINAVEHGNLAISYEEKSTLHVQDNWLTEVERRLNLPIHAHKNVKVHFERQNDKIKISVTDMGEGFDWIKYQKIDAKRLLDSHGRGIALARSLVFADLEYNVPGNCVTCIIELNPCQSSKSN